MKHYEKLLAALVAACKEVYGERLVSVAVFGSVGRGTARPDSDIDLLIVASPLPDGRLARATEFEGVERLLRAEVAALHEAGVTAELSPVFKTPEELAAGSPLLLDMVEDARILYDRGRVLEAALMRLRERLQKLGARRIWRGDAWYWDLKPDYRPGEVFEL
ncbi:MAG: nucleotidyltransferase domain-containing protein [bacterium]|jgi:predicted nucleotidyltransferase|nr:nucleotidyltransferase domain-containing protein [candidate division KSB1 bacterium]MDH7559852.1 nucleotidyltransferase domain-containing protein [bacterium]